MKRRHFIGVIGGIAVALPLIAHAQVPGRTYRLGFLVPVARGSPGVVALFDELRLKGVVEGRNLDVIAQGFEVSNDRISEIAKALVDARPDAIFSGGDPATRALQQLTKTIPILCMTEDLVAAGFAASLAKPGGNITGISLLSPELDGKRQEVLLEVLPSAHKIAALIDETVVPSGHIRLLEVAARSRNVVLDIVSVSGPEQIAPSLSKAKKAGAEAVNVLASPMLYLNRSIIFDRMRELRLPAVYQWPEMAAEGGFIAYGPRFTDTFRQRARILLKILSGVRPAEIPVEQPTKFELVINVKVAKTLELTIPPSLLARADEVIE